MISEVIVAVIALPISTDLEIASSAASKAGIIMACVLFMKRMSEETRIKSWKYADDSDESLMSVPKHISVYELSGPLFFAVSDQVRTMTCVILWMGAVPMMDTDAMRRAG